MCPARPGQANEGEGRTREAGHDAMTEHELGPSLSLSLSQYLHHSLIVTSLRQELLWLNKIKLKIKLKVLKYFLFYLVIRPVQSSQ